MSLRKRIVAAAELSGEAPLKFLENLMALYERNFATEETTLTEREQRLIKLVPDPTERNIFRSVMRLMGSESAKLLTPEARKNRASAGGLAKAKNLTLAERKNHAQHMAKKRWAKKQTPPE